MDTSGISSPFELLSRSFGQVAYVLRDRSPLGIAPPLDLHFLGTPQAFVLSQDQTLHQKTDVNPTSEEVRVLLFLCLYCYKQVILARFYKVTMARKTLIGQSPHKSSYT